MKFYDLSIPITSPDDLVFDPPLTQPKIEYSSHEEGADQMQFIFRKLQPEKHLPNGKGWATEKLTLSTHSGTHMDAPYHFAPIQDKEIGKKEALTIDQIPLEWCIGPLVVLNCTDLEDGYLLTPEDINSKLKEIDHELREGDIVCIHTIKEEFFGTKEYINHGVGVSREATLHILRMGVHIVGTDAWSWDAPFSITAKKWKKGIKQKSPDPSIIWEGHFAGRDIGYFQMEKLTNLDKVPPTGATIYCFPIKIKNASAGWVRAVASLPE
ncbi:MAG: cyclase family protein [Promethearchaeia archaeon]